MKTIALIPARLESERFPNKLIKKLDGVPIIVRTYLAALNSKLFEENNLFLFYGKNDGAKIYT